jgi:ribosomal protein S18 acetylase RimI-like enzyme
VGHVLDNVFWHALTGEQASIAEGSGGARRYARGFSPILGFADQAAPDFAALDPVSGVGERVHAGRWREVSGICTHPQHQGRGLARRLASKIVSRQLRRGQAPFLHVMSANAGARALYLRMGFGDYHETVVRVVEKAA